MSDGIHCICGAFQGKIFIFTGFSGGSSFIPYCNKCGLGGYTGDIDPYPIYWGKKFRKIYADQILNEVFFADFEYYWDDGKDWFWEGYEDEGWALFEVIKILREFGFP